MDKTALQFDPKVIQRHALGGLLAGGSAALLINLLHAVRLEKEKQKMLREPSETDEDTIVLTLPPKTARIKQAGGWPTLTVAALSGIGGSALGYVLVNKLYRNRLLKQLKSEEEQNRQEFLDKLMGGDKLGSAFLDNTFSLTKTKEAQENPYKASFSWLDTPIAGVLLLSLLGGGATAYITKRILDEHAKTTAEKEYTKPRLRRIVFRSSPTLPNEELPPGEEKLSSADFEGLRAAVGIMVDGLDGRSRILNSPQVKEAMDRANLTNHQLYKLALGDAPDGLSNLLGIFEQQPQLRRAIQSAFMERHPVLKHFRWALNVPGLSHIADSKLYSAARNFFNPSGVAGVADMSNVKSADLLEQLVPSGGDIVGGILGGAVSQPDDLEDSGAGIKERPLPDPAKVKRLVQSIQLSADDPQAQAFLSRRKRKIRNLLTQLATEEEI